MDQFLSSAVLVFRGDLVFLGTINPILFRGLD